MRLFTLLFLIFSLAACSSKSGDGPDAGGDASGDAVVDGDATDVQLPETCDDGSERGDVTACPSDSLVYACGNGCDDDGDGDLDLEDDGCAGDPCRDSEEPALCPDGSPEGPITACPNDGLVYACGNGCDDDGDGKVDLDDELCDNPCHASEAVSAGGAGPIVPCGGTVYLCGNGLDDDGDGLVDADDPECLGPCDNNEQGLFHAIPGGASGVGSCTLDCYFDDNSGSGGGDCLWNLECDELEPRAGGSCPYDATSSAQSHTCDQLYNDQLNQRGSCDDNCFWRVPNGCDCFGCCLFPTEEEPERHLFIGTMDAEGVQRCTLADAQSDSPQYCDPCTPVPSCQNECDECELCLGKDTLPAHCLEEPTDPDAGVDPPPARCAEGQQACGLPGDADCDSGFYCNTGGCLFFGGAPG